MMIAEVDPAFITDADMLIIDKKCGLKIDTRFCCANCGRTYVYCDCTETNIQEGE